MSELTTLTLELATLRKRELQTTTQLESVVSSEKQLQNELTNLKAKMSGEFEANNLFSVVVFGGEWRVCWL